MYFNDLNYFYSQYRVTFFGTMKSKHLVFDNLFSSSRNCYNSKILERNCFRLLGDVIV